MTAVQIVEVGPRDGFQNIGPFIPTETKIAMIRDLAAAGLRRMEVTSFVSPRAIPQLADAAEVLADVLARGTLLPQVLVPNARYGHKAIEAGARFLSYVISISESHSRSNVRAKPDDALADYVRLVAEAPAGIRMRINLATAFHCHRRHDSTRRRPVDARAGTRGASRCRGLPLRHDRARGTGAGGGAVPGGDDRASRGFGLGNACA